MALQTADIPDVEIFGVGTHNGQTYTEADLDEIVRAFQELRNSGDGGYSPPIKLDHIDGQPTFDDVPPDGGPAFGWVDNLRRVGSTLIADFKAVPAKLKDLIDAGAYRPRSAEIWWDLEVDGKKYAKALKAVALLGVRMAAVRSLKDMVKLYEGQPVFQYDAERQAKVQTVFSFEDMKGGGAKALIGKIMDGMKELMGMMPANMTEDFAEAIEGAWDGSAATARVRRWATSNGEIDFGKYRRAFAVMDGPADNVSSYKFPHHDVRDGQLLVHRGGVRAALAAAGGARSGQANPTAQRHMGMHKTEMGMEDNMDGVTIEQFNELKVDYEAKFAGMEARVTSLTAENKALGETNAALTTKHLEQWAQDTVRAWTGERMGNQKRLLAFAQKFGQDSEEVKEYIGHETVTAQMLQEAGLFTEIGVGGPGHASAGAAIEAAIKKHTDGGKARDVAIRLVAAEEPKLYAEYAATVRDNGK